MRDQLKRQAIWSSGEKITLYLTTRRNISENFNLNCHRQEDRGAHMWSLCQPQIISKRSLKIGVKLETNMLILILKTKRFL
jgi:hypothetical protein